MIWGWSSRQKLMEFLPNILLFLRGGGVELETEFALTISCYFSSRNLFSKLFLPLRKEKTEYTKKLLVYSKYSNFPPRRERKIEQRPELLLKVVGIFHNLVFFSERGN